MFSGISNIEEVAFNALSFVWNPTEEAKVKTPLSPKEGFFFSVVVLSVSCLGRASSPKAEGTGGRF